MIKENISSNNKFGLKDKLGYMFGDFGNDFFFIFASSFLMVFYTDVFGISPTITGIVFLVARLWDAIMDVAVGRFIDSRPATKNGKFKPWIMRFAPILLVFGILMFTKVPGLSNQFYLVYAFATYIIWGSLYSTVNIPYGSMASVITSDPVERASLSTFRSIGAALAGMIISTVVPMVVFINNKADSNRFFIVAVIMAMLAMICYTLCYKLSTERVTAATSLEHKGSLLVSLKGLTKNKPFLSIVVASLTLIIAMLLSGSLNTYLYKDYFRNTKALSLAGFVTILNVVMVAPAIAPISKKFGKKESAAVALFFSAAAYFLLYLIPIKNAYLFVAFSFIANLGYNFFNFMLWAFVTDVIDYQEYITEKREDGTVYSIYSFARKVGQAIAGVMGGVALGFAGYVAKAPQQTAEVVSNIRSLATLIPAVTYFIVFLIIAFVYPMTKEALTEIQDELERRRTGKIL
ncbi:MFS transporter [Clostridium fungisolvens]|uniref:Putative symporter YjmB n=1 Tax=Clostridium fungisolvens TaxID=1604897 RepID=A0A6V8SHR7_9CLOT|nr:glycoside-pentoside-hexuronide (GPH):cation symporter [Clostridium fungisolvens]GFP74423.1 putative symporter YjmB [Clostridium fungisolvens]